MLQRRAFTQKPRPERQPLPWPEKVRSCNQAPSTDLVVSQPKENAIESEPYRRLVAALPCSSCRIVGYSQAAHPPPTGKSRKEDDRTCFPLCCTRPGEPGCHQLFDQYVMFPRALADEFALIWGIQTRSAIIAAGLWPSKLPFYEQKQPLALDTRAQPAMNKGAT